MPSSDEGRSARNLEALKAAEEEDAAEEQRRLTPLVALWMTKKRS